MGRPTWARMRVYSAMLGAIAIAALLGSSTILSSSTSRPVISAPLAASVATSGGPTDLGLSAFEINVTSISKLVSDDLSGPFYVLQVTFTDTSNSSIPSESESIGGGSGCSNCGTVGYSFPDTDTAQATLSLFDNQSWAGLGLQAVEFNGASTTRTLTEIGSRAGSPVFQVSSTSSGSCSYPCKSASVSISVTVESILKFQNEASLSIYTTYAAWVSYLSSDTACAQWEAAWDASVTDAQNDLVPVILDGFLLGTWGAFEPELESMLPIVAHVVADLLGSDIDALIFDAFQVAEDRATYEGQDLVSCEETNIWYYFAVVGGYATDVEDDLAGVTSDLQAVQSDILDNDVPNLANDLNSLSIEMQGLVSDLGSVESSLSDCDNASWCAPYVTEIIDDVVNPMVSWSQQDSVYVAQLAGLLSQASESMTIDGSPAGSFSTSGLALSVGEVNQAYSAGLQVGGGMLPQTYSIAVVSGTVPPGLSFGGNGACAAWNLCGTPTGPGTWTFSGQLTDGAGDVVTVPFTIAIDNWHQFAISASPSELGYWKVTECVTVDGERVCETETENYGTQASIHVSYSFDGVASPETVTFSASKGSLSASSCTTSGGACSVTLTDSTAGSSTISASTQGYTVSVGAEYCTSSSPCSSG